MAKKDKEWVTCKKHNQTYHIDDGCCDRCTDEWVAKQSSSYAKLSPAVKATKDEL